MGFPPGLGDFVAAFLQLLFGVRPLLALLLLHDAAVEEVDASVGMAREALVVGHHADRRAAPVQLLEERHHGFAVDGVEVSRRLVGEKDERLAGDRPRDGHTLLLAARELRGEVLHPVRHADALQGLLHALLALVGGHAAVGQRQLHVLEDREVADQVEALEDESDLPIPDASALGERELLGRLAVQGVVPVGGRVEQAEDRKQRRLAASRRPGDRHVLAVGDLEVDPREGVRLDLIREENLRDAIELDYGLPGAAHCRSFSFRT